MLDRPTSLWNTAVIIWRNRRYVPRCICMNVHGTTSNGKSFPPPRFTIQENGILTPSYTHIAEEEEEEEERTVITGFPIYFSIRCALGGSLKGGESPPFWVLPKHSLFRGGAYFFFFFFLGSSKASLLLPRLFTYGGGEKFLRVGRLV